MNIFDFAQYPKPEDWDNICEQKKEALDKIQLAEPNKTFSFFDFGGIELSYWVKEFNNRVFDLVNNYVMMMNYYNMGIPDKEWFISPGRNGQSVQYFPHFEDKHYIYLYWFGFYMDGYYSKFFGLIDSIYHLINVSYVFGVENSLGFRKKVADKLEKQDKELFDYLESIRINAIYKSVSDFRNNMTHNYRPNQIDSGINQKKENGKIIISMTVGNYTPSIEFVNNINDSIDLLALIVDNVRDKILN